MNNHIALLDQATLLSILVSEAVDRSFVVPAQTTIVLCLLSSCSRMSEFVRSVSINLMDTCTRRALKYLLPTQSRILLVF